MIDGLKKWLKDQKGWHSFCQNVWRPSSSRDRVPPTSRTVWWRTKRGQRWLGKSFGFPPVVSCSGSDYSLVPLGTKTLYQETSQHFEKQIFPPSNSHWRFGDPCSLCQRKGGGYPKRDDHDDHEVWNPEVTGCISARAVNFLMKLIAAKCSARTAMETPRNSMNRAGRKRVLQTAYQVPCVTSTFFFRSGVWKRASWRE